MAIIINRKKGFTVGQVVLFINIFIFAAYGMIFYDWHIALKSLLTYVVAFKIIDLVIVGLDELKSVLIISSKPEDFEAKLGALVDLLVSDECQLGKRREAYQVLRILFWKDLDLSFPKRPKSSILDKIWFTKLKFLISQILWVLGIFIDCGKPRL